MSQFIKRPGKPHNGDWAHDNNTDTDVCLECEIAPDEKKQLKKTITTYIGVA